VGNAGKARQELVSNVRARLSRQMAARGASPQTVELAGRVLDPNVLTLGFARRFTGYKRPNLLLHDPDRLMRLLSDQLRPVQIVFAGKAHPADTEGKHLIQAWLALAQTPALRNHAVFLEDYDISLAQELVRGVDVWINTPRPPWEASGTSGMKVLVNGGLNMSVLDGWWEEAYTPDVGWAVEGIAPSGDAERDAYDAEMLYATLETKIVPEFYDRDARGMPQAWLARIRRSMAALTPQFSSTRMVRQYLEMAYLPAARALKQRVADGASPARAMQAWQERLSRNWQSIHIGPPVIEQESAAIVYTVPVYLGEVEADDVEVEIYAEPTPSEPASTFKLARNATISGTTNGYLYTGNVPASRPADHHTVRIVPHHPSVRIPNELAMILWRE
jgi:starch phosphorylase